MNNKTKRKQGFTLIEVIAVLVVLGILTAIALPRYVDLQENAKSRAIDAGIAELNGRESLVWANALLSQGGYVDDVNSVWSAMETDNNLDLGSAYTWQADPTRTEGGLLEFQEATGVQVNRSESSETSPAVWSGPIVP